MSAVVRCKVLVEGSLQWSLPGRMMMGFGLLSVVLAAFFLWRQRDVKRLFAYSSIEHMGIIAFAFGMGGPGGHPSPVPHLTGAPTRPSWPPAPPAQPERTPR